MDLSIIILNYNTSSLLKQTIESIKTDLIHEIIVIDNASTDDSVEMIRHNFKHIKLITNKKNIGFAAGNNLGLHQAKGRYVLLLNSDTLVQDGALEKLVSVLDTNRQISAVTPKLVLEDGSLDPACHRALPTLWNSLIYFSGLEKLAPRSKVFGQYHMTWLDLDTSHRIEACSMAAMMFRRTLIDEIGYLDEDFFMYAEDLDYCKRIADAGGEIQFVAEAKIIHLKGKSGTHSPSVKTRQTTRKHFYQTMKHYFHKHYSKTYPSWLFKLIDLSIDIVAKLRG